MSKKYIMVTCPVCNKRFNPKEEGGLINQRLCCGDCTGMYNKAANKSNDHHCGCGCGHKH